MKCRDRDALEAVLQRWERSVPLPGAEPEAVPVPEAVPGPPGWDRRLRRRLGARYEARAAVADWELRMALHPRGATSVSPAEFGRWRENGDAFGGGGATPNPTVLSDPRPRADGRSVSPPSYWGDTVTGPFLSFGLGPTGTQNPPKTASELSLAAVTELLHELLTGDTPRTGDTPGDTPKTGDTPGDTPGNGDTPKTGDTPGDDPNPLGPLAPLPLRVRFLPLGGPPETPARLGGRCRLLVLGWRSLPLLTPQLGALAAPGATLLLELPTFVPTLGPAHLDSFRARALALARAGGFEPGGVPGSPRPTRASARPRPLRAETPPQIIPKIPETPPQKPAPNYS
ncbi:dynein axonemal assembly factor 3 [Agelaius phoeniceus]|uniref:dynein axonemal assembly factor 3 n=1 Tax=Agelaius phoeniceus TaxID=39638 RepID=UPI004054D22B